MTAMHQRAPLTSSTIVVRGEPLTADLGGEIVLMSVESGKYFGLDEIGSEIWQRLQSPTRIDALCSALEETYDAEADVIARDVMRLLNDLLDHGLIAVKDH